MVDNPYTMWSDVNADLPGRRKSPPSSPAPSTAPAKSSRRNVILVGCEETGAMQAMMDMGMDEDAEEACLEIRADGVPPTSTATTPRRWRASTPTPTASAFSVWPSTRTTPTAAGRHDVRHRADRRPIASGEYPVSRPLFFYIKKAHLDVIPGLRNTPSSSSPTTSQAPSARWPPTASFPTRNWPRPRPLVLIVLLLTLRSVISSASSAQWQAAKRDGVQAFIPCPGYYGQNQSHFSRRCPHCSPAGRLAVCAAYPRLKASISGKIP
jgi:hypothetical protein